MAIKAVRDNFVQMLKSSHGASSALRTHAGNVFKHTMYVKTSDMERLLKKELNRVLREENKARQMYYKDAVKSQKGNIFQGSIKKAMMGGTAGQFNRDIPINKQEIEKCAKAIIAKHLMNPKTFHLVVLKYHRQ